MSFSWQVPIILLTSTTFNISTTASVTVNTSNFDVKYVMDLFYAPGCWKCTLDQDISQTSPIRPFLPQEPYHSMQADMCNYAHFYANILMDGWMNQAYGRLSTTNGHITDCKLLVCMLQTYWTSGPVIIKADVRESHELNSLRQINSKKNTPTDFLVRLSSIQL